jgi:hypothetical protein
MTIGNFSHGAGRGDASYTQLNTDFKELIPTGQTTDVYGNNIHLPFSRNDANYTNKRYYPTIREKAGFKHDHDYDDQPLTQINPTVSVFTNLYNFNATHKELSYFEPHNTDKLIQHPYSRPRFTAEKAYDISIPQEINKLKENTAPDFFKLPQHSFTLNKRRK